MGSESSLRDFSALDAARAHTQLLRRAVHHRLHCLQIHVPTPPRNVVRVRNVIAKARPFPQISQICAIVQLQVFECFRSRLEPPERAQRHALSRCRIFSISAPSVRHRAAPAAPASARLSRMRQRVARLRQGTKTGCPILAVILSEARLSGRSRRTCFLELWRRVGITNPNPL